MCGGVAGEALSRVASASETRDPESHERISDRGEGGRESAA
jgi:hypothetical protein